MRSGREPGLGMSGTDFCVSCLFAGTCRRNRGENGAEMVPELGCGKPRKKAKNTKEGGVRIASGWLDMLVGYVVEVMKKGGAGEGPHFLPLIGLVWCGLP